MENNRQLLSQNLGLIYCLAGFALLVFIAWQIIGLIWPFIAGLVIAYLFVPVVDWIERHLPFNRRFAGIKRTLSMALTSSVLLTAGGFFAFFMIRAFIEAFADLLPRAPGLIIQAVEVFEAWTRNLAQILPEGLSQDVYTSIQNLSLGLLDATREMLLETLLRIPDSMGLLLGMFILPFFLFYLVRDWHWVWRSVSGALPESAAGHARSITHIIRHVIGGYIRAQGVLGIGVGIIVYAGLAIMGIPFAPAMAGVAALGEFIPVVGPWASAAFALVITLATVPEMVIWVGILFLAANTVENSLMRPKIEGSFLKLHPAFVLVLIVIGSYAAGFWGLLLAVPLTATLVRIAAYIRRSLVIQKAESGP